MTSMEMLQTAMIFLVGLLLRLMLALVVLAAIALPVVAAVDVWNRIQTAWHNRRESSADGLVWRAGLAYAPSHTWVRRRWGRATVGLDDLARRMVAPPRVVALPRVGTTVHAGDVVAEVTSGGRRAPIVSPMDGRVTAVNPEVVRDPSVLGRDSYGRGWLFRIAPGEDAGESLALGAAAREWFRAEGRAFSLRIEHDLGLVAADGGGLAAPPSQSLSDEQWRSLVKAFLKA